MKKNTHIYIFTNLQKLSKLNEGPLKYNIGTFLDMFQQTIEPWFYPPPYPPCQQISSHFRPLLPLDA